jgi:hypothetical protein
MALTGLAKRDYDRERRLKRKANPEKRADDQLHGRRRSKTFRSKHPEKVKSNLVVLGSLDVDISDATGRLTPLVETVPGVRLKVPVLTLPELLAGAVVDCRIRGTQDLDGQLAYLAIPPWDWYAKPGRTGGRRADKRPLDLSDKRSRDNHPLVGDRNVDTKLSTSISAAPAPPPDYNEDRDLGAYFDQRSIDGTLFALLRGVSIWAIRKGAWRRYAPGEHKPIRVSSFGLPHDRPTRVFTGWRWKDRARAPRLAPETVEKVKAFMKRETDVWNYRPRESWATPAHFEQRINLQGYEAARRGEPLSFEVDCEKNKQRRLTGGNDHDE